MGAEYWAQGAVRLISRDDGAAKVPLTLGGFGRYNRSRTVWIWETDIADSMGLQTHLQHVENFLKERRELADTDARVNVFMGWAPDRPEEIAVRASLLDVLVDVRADLIIDVYNSDPNFVDDAIDDLIYWSRLAICDSDETRRIVLTDGDTRRTGDLADVWLDQLRAGDQNLSVPASEQHHLLLEWIPAHQDGLVLPNQFVQELAQRHLELVVRVNASSAPPGPSGP